MSEYPTIMVGGEHMEIRDRTDVRDAFTRAAGFDVGDAVEEYTVDAIDAEFDYIQSDSYEGDELRVYAYFDPITPNGQSAVVGNDDLHVPGWVRDEYMTSGDGVLGVVYKWRPA